MIYAVSVTKWQKEQWKLGELDVVAYVHDKPEKLRIFKNLEELIKVFSLNCLSHDSELLLEKQNLFLCLFEIFFYSCFHSIHKIILRV